jgi:hypothetical protein
MKGRVVVQVSAIEFQESGNTLWIHGPQGGTTLRVKTTGKVTSSRCDTSPTSHGDVVVQQDIHLCLGKDETMETIEKLLSSYDAAHQALVRCWTKAVGTPGYVKKDFMTLDNELSRRFGDLARSMGYYGPLIRTRD